MRPTETHPAQNRRSAAAAGADARDDLREPSVRREADDGDVSARSMPHVPRVERREASDHRLVDLGMKTAYAVGRDRYRLLRERGGARPG